jgi:cytochrome c-type biogenesis protein CcmH/NrfF
LGYLTKHSASLFLVLALTLSGAVFAGAAQAEGWGYDLGGELMSPFCPGRTLSSCPSPQAAELVQWIVTQEAAGTTREEVLEMLIERYGEEILGAPPAEGITLWAYILPVAGFMSFGVVAFLVLRRVVGPGAEASSDMPPHSAPLSTPFSAPHAPSSVSIAKGFPATSEGGSVAASTGAGIAPMSDDELARMVDAELASRG